MTPSSTITLPARFLLLGDSHAGVIGKACEGAGIAFCGGPIGSGRDFNADFFDIIGGAEIGGAEIGGAEIGGADIGKDLAFRAEDAEKFYRGFLAELGIAGLDQLPVPLVSTFGLGLHFVATKENWQIYRLQDGQFVPGFLASTLFADIVCAHARGALAFYRFARRLGLRVLAVLPPQRVPALSDREIFQAAQAVLGAALGELGVEVVDVRTRTTDADGNQLPRFCPADDPIHGNLAFGRLILAELLGRGL